MKLRAFTLIELLVVISIIGVLSSIVLSSLNTARNKSIDAATRAQLVEAQKQAALYYAANESTTTTPCNPLADSGNVKGIYSYMLAGARTVGITTVSLDAVGGPGIAVCNAASPSVWAAQIPLKGTSGAYFCVDSNGTATTTNTNLITRIKDTDCQ